MINNMTVKDIEEAISQLPHAEMVELSEWFEEFEAQQWDDQIEDDAKAGRLKAFIDQAKADYDAGRSKSL